jgi:hypothetical protein
MHHISRRNDESGKADRFVRDGRHAVHDCFRRESPGIAA